MDDLCFKAYKAHIPPKWQLFAQTGTSSGACGVVSSGSEAMQERERDKALSNRVAKPEATFNPNGRFGKLIRSKDRTIHNHQDLHYSRFLFGPERIATIDALRASSDDEDDGSPTGASPKKKAPRPKISEGQEEFLIAPETKTKRTWLEEMSVYCARERVKKDAADRTARLELELAQRQRTAAARREREVERYAVSGEKRSADDRDDPTVRAAEENRAAWYRALVCSAQEVHGDAVRQRLRNMYEEKQRKRIAKAEAHLAHVEKATKHCLVERAHNAHSRGYEHQEKMDAAAVRAQAKKNATLSKIVRNHERREEITEEINARKAAQSESAAREREAERQRCLDRFEQGLQDREEAEARREAAMLQKQSEVADRLFDREVGRMEHIAEVDIDRRISAAEASRRQQHERVLQGIEAGKVQRERRLAALERSRVAELAAHVASREEREHKAEGNVSRLRDEKIARDAAIMDKYHPEDAQRSPSSSKMTKKTRKRRQQGREEEGSLRSDDDGAASETSFAFNYDHTSVVAAKLAIHQARAYELADDAAFYAAEREADLIARDKRFEARKAEQLRSLEKEAAERAAKHDEKCRAARAKKAQREQRIEEKMFAKEAGLVKRLQQQEKAWHLHSSAEAAALALKTRAALDKVNVERHEKLLESIAHKQAIHEQRKQEQEAQSRAEQAEKLGRRKERVEELKSLVESTAKNRDEHYATLLASKVDRQHLADLQRDDLHHEKSQQLAAAAKAREEKRMRQEEAEHAAHEAALAKLAADDAAEKRRVDALKEDLIDYWKAKNQEINHTIDDCREKVWKRLGQRTKKVLDKKVRDEERLGQSKTPEPWQQHHSSSRTSGHGGVPRATASTPAPAPSAIDRRAHSSMR